MPAYCRPSWESDPKLQLSLDVLDASGTARGSLDLAGRSHVVFGRDATTSDVAVDDRGVSRSHAALVHHRNGKVYLIDLRSTHGTRLDGEPLEPHKPRRVKDGCKVQLGHAQSLYVVKLAGNRPSSGSAGSGGMEKRSTARQEEGKVVVQGADKDPDAVVRCSHILVKHKDSRRPSSWKEKVVRRSKEEALNMVGRMREDIIQGKATFAELARIESHCSSAKKGGDLGEFKRGVMQPQFEEKAFSLAVGKISEPFLSDSGAHIILRTS